MHRGASVAWFALLTVTSTAFAGEISGELKQWHAVTVTFDGPQSSESATPNPFSDYRLDVIFTGPSGQTYQVPGYYAADGNAAETGATSGNKWRVRFCPDAAGLWQYEATFVEGTKIAAQPTGGTSAGYFDGETGSFAVAATDKPADGVDLRGKGKLEYVGDHYLRFRNGRYFIKSGSNAPETFLEYNDFDGTPLNLDYSAHVADWRSGDPTWRSDKGKGIVGALNYLSGLGVNSMYFLTMNSHGDGNKAWPWTGTNNVYNYDCSKLDQWDVVFTHMDALGMMLHVVLSETENESFFEVLELGAAGGFAPSRKLYYREMVARFGHHLAITWNLGEENGWDDGGGYATGLTTQQQKDASDYLRALTYYDDNITVHNGPSTDDGVYASLVGHANLTGAEIQWNQGSGVHAKVLFWRSQSLASGHRWVVSLDEPWTSQTVLDEFRRWDVWGSYVAGAAGCEFFQSGDAGFDDFRGKEAFYTTLARARRFIEDHVPYPVMTPADGLVSGASAYCLAAAGQVYLVYLRSGGIASLDLTGAGGTFDVRWFDPRSGGALQTGSVASVTGGGVRSLGSPPVNPGSDWVALVGTCPPGATVYRDADGDGSGDPAEASVTGCGGSVPAGYVDDATDCDDANAAVYLDAAEVNDGVDNQCPGGAGFGVTDELTGTSGFATAGDKTRLSWTPQTGATAYQVVRSTSRSFSSGCTLLSSSNPFVVDAASPTPGVEFHYVVRPSAPFAGSWGQRSDGSPRGGGCLPP